MRTEKPTQKSSRALGRILADATLLFALASTQAALGQVENKTANSAVDERILSALQTSESDNLWSFGSLFSQDLHHRQEIVRGLIAILDDPKAKGYAKGYAAYYLGVMHASEAVDRLADAITNSLPATGHLNIDDSPWRADPAAHALRVIGIPSIPALIRNLAESDDGRVRVVSLGILNGIENDKDISTLRLQKAIKAETDPKKQARLRAAIGALADPAFR
jgi:hypothetical protein